MPGSAGTLVSVNVGMPRDVSWRGRTVFTGVFKDPVTGPRRVRRLNIDGDGQGDLGGHGGEQRAVFVYQLDSYRYWERELGRTGLVPGQFGENFTVDGLADAEVCIGDRYAIGTAVFEVTQPRVTCYRVGIRMEDPRIPALLVSHRRPGFYFRVIEEGDVEAGDDIVKLAAGPEGMAVAEVDGLLYLPGHTRQQLLRALRIPALSPGWQASFRALLDEGEGGGNAGLAVTSPPPAWPGFRRLTVTAITPESDSIVSIRLEDPDGARVARRRPGQYLTLRVRPDEDARPLLRNYSLSGPPDGGFYRISVKREHDGAASGYLHTRLAVGDRSTSQRHAAPSCWTARMHPCCSSAPGSAPPRCSPCSRRWRRSAPNGRSGGCTARAAAASTRSPRRPERSLATLPNATAHVLYSRPGPDDVAGRDYERAGRLSASVLAELDPPADAEAYVCGPLAFMDEMSAGLAASGLDASRIHTEPFGPAPGMTPGIAATPARRPHPPDGDPGTARRSSSPAAASRSRGAATTRACWSSPRRATSPSAGRAAPASATAARRRSSPAISSTTPIRSSLPRRAARSSAARSRATTSCSTCDRR